MIRASLTSLAWQRLVVLAKPAAPAAGEAPSEEPTPWHVMCNPVLKSYAFQPNYPF